MNKGERVRLTPEYARVLMSSPKSKGMDWLGRVGTVCVKRRRESCLVQVKWDGRKTADSLDARALEVVR